MSVPKEDTLIKIAKELDTDLNGLFEFPPVGGERQTSTPDDDEEPNVIAFDADAQAGITTFPVPTAEERPPGRSGYSPAGCIWYTDNFLRFWGLNPTMCKAARILDDSMEPGIPEGSVVLADMCRPEPIPGGIFMFFDATNLHIARRMFQAEDEQWVLTSDRLGYADIPWSGPFEMVGRIVWTTRMLLSSEEQEAAPASPRPRETGQI